MILRFNIYRKSGNPNKMPSPVNGHKNPFFSIRSKIKPYCEVCFVRRSLCAHKGPIVSRESVIQDTLRERNRIQAETSSKSSDQRTLQEEVEPSVDNQTSITMFKEAANVVTQEISGLEHLQRISNPFPDNTPKDVLERVYRIGSFSWTPGMSPVIYKFPDALGSLTPIANYLTVFKYFRAGVRIQIKLNSTPYHQGALIVGTGPTLDLSTSVWNPYTLSMMKPIVLSASVQDSCTIDLPYINPGPWMQYTPFPSCGIGSFAIQELNELITTSTSVPASVEVLVYASFLNPKVAQYVEPIAAQSGKSRFMHADGSTSIGADKNNEAEEKASKGVDTKGLQKVVGGVSEIIKMIPIIGDIYRPIANFISTWGRNLDLPTDTQAVTTILDYPFRYQNNTRGLFMGERLSLYPSSSLTMENFGMESSEMSLTELAMVPGLYSQFSFANKNDTLFIVAHPINSATSIFSYNTCDYVCFLAGIHQYWRGSLKYMFHFVSCAFYSARFQISYSLINGTNINGDLPSQIIDVKGDTITEVTIPYLWNTYWRKTGQSSVVPNTPVMSIRMITPIAGSTSPSTPVIYLNVWRSGGEDTQFAVPKNSYDSLPWAGTQVAKKRENLDSSRMIAQTSIVTRFKSSFKPIVEPSKFTMEVGNCMTETSLTVKDLIRRFSAIPSTNWQTTADFTNPWSQPIMTPSYFAELFSALSFIFLFWRGSRRVRTCQNGADIAVLNGIDSSFNPSPSSGLVMANVNLTSDLKKTEFEVPFFSEVPYVHVYRPISALTYIPLYDLPLGMTILTNGSSYPFQLHLAAGDDFQYLYLIPPIFPTGSAKLRSKGKTVDTVRDSKHTNV